MTSDDKRGDEVALHLLSREDAYRRAAAWITKLQNAIRELAAGVTRIEENGVVIFDATDPDFGMPPPVPPRPKVRDPQWGSMPGAPGRGKGPQ